MAMAAGGKSAIADINMTPMIDVLLVLLVIFIIAQPMLQRSIDIQLPAERKSTATSADAPVIILEMRANGAMYLNTQTVPAPNLRARLLEVYTNRPDRVLFIKAEGGVKYGDVITAMDIARGSGVEVVGAVLPALPDAGTP